MSEAHPLVLQLRFTRAEFLRGVRGVPAEDAKRRLGPMNSLSWNVGHLAWQEQRYFLTRGQGITPYPEIQQQFAYGAPGTHAGARRDARGLAGDHGRGRSVARHRHDGEAARGAGEPRQAASGRRSATCSSA